MPLSVLPTDPRYWRATWAVWRPALRSPVSSSTSTPWSWGRVAGSATSSSNRRWLTRSWSQVDSDTNHCRPWTAACWAPTTGSAPTRQVMVLLRSLGSSSPLQVGAQAAALREPGEQGVELGGVALQRAGGGWAGKALGHGAHLRAQAAETLLYTQPLLKSTNHR